MKQLFRTLLIVLASGALFLALVPGMTWDGASWKSVKVRVTQGAAHTPLRGARVVLLREEQVMHWMGLGDAEREKWLDEWMSSTLAGETGADGQVMLHSHFPAGGQNTFLVRSGSFSITGQVFVIRSGRVLAMRRLAELTPRKKYSLSNELPLIEMELP